jgi:hypothetical protein
MKLIKQFLIFIFIITPLLFGQAQFIGNANFSYANKLINGSILRLPYRMLELKYIHESDNVILHSEFAIEWNRKKDTRFLSDNNPQDFIMDLRELYLTWYIPMGEVNIGKQIHSWGFVDENSPLDNLNALDYYYLFESGASRKIGSYSLSSQLYWNDISLNFVYSPFHNASRLPIVNGKTDDEFPFGFPMIPKENEILIKNSQPEFGWKLEFPFMNSNIAITQFYGYDRIFNFSGINVFTNDWQSFHYTDLVFGYRKTGVTGLSGQYFIGDLSLRADLGIFNTSDINHDVIRESPYIPTTYNQIAYFDSIPQTYPMEEKVKYTQFNIQAEYELPFEISLLTQYFNYIINNYTSNGLPIDQDIDIPNFEIDIEQLKPENLFVPGMGSPLAVLTNESILFNLSKELFENQLKLNIGSLLDLTNKPNGIFNENENYIDLNENGNWDEDEEFTDQPNDKFQIYGKLINFGIEYDITSNLNINILLMKIIGSDYYPDKSNYPFNMMEDISNLRLDIKYSF